MVKRDPVGAKGYFFLPSLPLTKKKRTGVKAVKSKGVSPVTPLPLLPLFTPSLLQSKKGMVKRVKREYSFYPLTVCGVRGDSFYPFGVRVRGRGRGMVKREYSFKVRGRGMVITPFVFFGTVRRNTGKEGQRRYSFYSLYHTSTIYSEGVSLSYPYSKGVFPLPLLTRTPPYRTKKNERGNYHTLTPFFLVKRVSFLLLYHTSTSTSYL